MDGTFQSYDSSSNQSGYSKNKITKPKIGMKLKRMIHGKFSK